MHHEQLRRRRRRSLRYLYANINYSRCWWRRRRWRCKFPNILPVKWCQCRAARRQCRDSQRGSCAWLLRWWPRRLAIGRRDSKRGHQQWWLRAAARCWFFRQRRVWRRLYFYRRSCRRYWLGNWRRVQHRQFLQWRRRGRRMVRWKWRRRVFSSIRELRRWRRLILGELVLAKHFLH